MKSSISFFPKSIEYGIRGTCDYLIDVFVVSEFFMEAQDEAIKRISQVWSPAIFEE